MPLNKAAGILMASLAIAANASNGSIEAPLEQEKIKSSADTTIVLRKPVKKAIPLSLTGDAGQCFLTSGNAPWEKMDPKCQKQDTGVQPISKNKIYLEIHKL